MRKQEHQLISTKNQLAFVKMSEEQPKSSPEDGDINNNSRQNDPAAGEVMNSVIAPEQTSHDEVDNSPSQPQAQPQQQPPQNDLLDMVFTLESEKQALIEESRRRITALRKDLEESLSENDQLKKKVTKLDQSLKQSVMLGGVDAPKSRQEQEELLLKAKTLLFEKTKENKQQEQHIDSLKKQVEAMKDVVQVSKDMLNLKTAECEHMEARLEKSQKWIQAEKEKCLLTEKKLVISKSVYDKLRAEYDTQSKIFKDLREVYDQKIKMLTKALEEAKKPK